MRVLGGTGADFGGRGVRMLAHEASVPSAAACLRLAVGGAIAATAALPTGPRWLTVLGFVILLGVPHGALDGEVARGLLRPRVGRLWFLVFALPYLALAALVLVAWHVAPLATLAGFLALSVWHFGSEDAGPGHRLEALARGGLPIAVPTLAHPLGVAHVFAAVTGLPLAGPPEWLVIGAWAWLAVALVWGLSAHRERRRHALGEVAALALAFALLPPLTAFGLYFVCVHAPRHVAELAADPHRAPRVVNVSSALRHALPVTALTLLLGLLLWPLYAGPTPERLLALTLQGLAALTLPHMMLDALASRACGPNAGAAALPTDTAPD